jgi:ABC-type Fe3+/spermidine/putrescine transport system ATPase subunit
MYVRLAFAIAASVEPDVLVVDEALAVGDAVFQHRCLRRLKDLQESGTTVLFVSHDLAAVRALCSRAILLNAGRIASDGRPVDVLNHYQKIIMARERAFEADSAATGEDQIGDNESSAPLSYTYRHGDGSAEILAADLVDTAQRPVHTVETGEPLTIRVRVRVKNDLDDPIIGFLIRNRHGISAYGTNTREQQIEFGQVRRGDLLEVIFSFNCWLGIDDYSVTCAIHNRNGEAFDWIDGARFFRVTSEAATEGVANLNASVSVRHVESAAALSA